MGEKRGEGRKGGRGEMEGVREGGRGEMEGGERRFKWLDIGSQSL